MKIKFTKMQGLGNDFVLIDCRDKENGCQLSGINELSRRLCDRRFGIGADQLLLLYPSKVADFRMEIFNADGSEIEMCGNGTRCIAKYLWDGGYSDKKIIEIETLAGIIRPERVDGLIKVDMGEPLLNPEKIPVRISNESRIIDYPLHIGDKEFKITCVSMGNPHAVIFVESLTDFPVEHYGAMIEKHQIFPKRANVEFIELLNTSEIKMKVWERGSGETLACGTGACAAAVASHLKKLTGRNVTVHLDGGDLYIQWDVNNRVYMTGPAEEVFRGEIEIQG